jgi:hypothetical protein
MAPSLPNVSTLGSYNLSRQSQIFLHIMPGVDKRTISIYSKNFFALGGGGL